ncbi:uncharacterized protein LOC142659935 [Rhinoderma darwinii]|uniref:uncharacterized protein LOC142659935 n=1 Tax=Rhinoderma darwinii TaxID=43563 RepID=UPI003F6618D6
MNKSKNVDKSVEIPCKTRQDGLPKSRDRRIMTLVRPPRDKTTGSIVTPERRGRPTLSRPGNGDVLNKEALERPCTNIDQSIEASEKRKQRSCPRSPRKSSKNEELMSSPGDSSEDVEIPEKQERRRPFLRKDGTVNLLRKGERGREEAELIIKRSRGRPLGSTRNKIQTRLRPFNTDSLTLDDNEPSTTFPTQKRGRGRPRRTKLLIDQTLDESKKKINKNDRIMAKGKTRLGKETRARKNVTKETVKNVEEAILGVKKTMPLLERSRQGEKRKMMVSLTDIIGEIKDDNESTEDAMMEKKQRGQPKKYESEIEIGGQLPDEGHCVTVKCEEAINEDSLPQTDAQPSQDPEWVKEPVHGEDVVDSQDTSSVTQWVQPPRSHGSEHLDFQQVLLEELSEFRSQLTRELEAVRGEVREGAELVRSAIAGVSAEIQRLGLILHPLVNFFSAMNLSAQESNCSPMTALFCPQQGGPPEGTTDTPQPSTQSIDTSTSPNGETSSFCVSSHDLSGESLPVKSRLVKKEDLLDGDRPCTYQTQTINSLQEDNSFLPHLDSPKLLSTRSFHKTTSPDIPDVCADVPDTRTHLTNSVDRHEVNSAVTDTFLLSDQKAGAICSSGSSCESSPVTSHNVLDRSYLSKSISFSVPPDRYSPASTSALYYNQDQSTIRSPHENSFQLNPTNPLQSPDYSERGHHLAMPHTQSSGHSLENVGPPLAESDTLLCQVVDMPGLTTPFVTLPQSFTGNPCLMSVDQSVDFEGNSSKQDSFQLSQDFPEISHSSEVPVFAQSTCSLSQACAQMPQPPPISILSHTALLQSERDFAQMLQGASD